MVFYLCEDEWEGFCSPNIFFCAENWLFQGETLGTDHSSVGEDVYAVGAGGKIFFHIPEYGDGLFFSVVLDVFLDGVGK